MNYWFNNCTKIFLWVQVWYTRLRQGWPPALDFLDFSVKNPGLGPILSQEWSKFRIPGHKVGARLLYNIGPVFACWVMPLG